jgi:type I restriction enzyme R subunit
MSGFSEEMLEDYMMEKLQEKGWRFVPADELERESLEEPLLVNNLIRALERLNRDKGIGPEEIDQVLKELRLKGAGTEGARAILNFLKTGVPVKFEKDRVVRYVRLFDYDEVEKNKFIVTRQAVYVAGDKEIRTDVMLYVNGIPLVNIELKNPTSFSENWYDAHLQIKDYEELIPELYKYVQIGVAAEQTARYFPIVPWQKEVRIHLWREEGKDDIDSIIEMLIPERLLDIIRFYLFFRVERGEETKVITRYMQYRAAEKIVRRVLDNLAGKDDKDRGLIWHWQGSGKTLTMIFAANKLHHLKELENPTVFFIIDRLDLEDQHYQEFTALDIVEPEIIGSIGDLKRVLRHDEGRGKRGIMMALVHKFRPEELSALQRELEELSKERETILTRKNVIAFIDEGHRTQYGILAGQMKKVLQKAFFFTFTGTPISKRGRDTYLEFGYPPQETYLDRYFITESIKDGFTKKIVYQPRLEEEVHLKKDMLETFLEVEFEDLDEGIREKVEERVRKKLNSINTYLQNPKRIERIAQDIAEHFKENLDGRFKAMVVAVSREACVLYKHALDKYLPKDYSEVVMTYTRRDGEPIQMYAKEARARYGGREMDDIKKDTIEKFKEEEVPKILIVTDMLLAGFDAPVLQTMYLDKPLKEHRLLQAIARTNRPFKDAKEAGLIIDYVGILKEVTKAFETYSKDYQGAISDMDALRREFAELIKDTLELFKDIPKDKPDRETLLKAIEVLTTNEEKSKRFMENYRTLRKLFELLASDESKVDLLPEYKWLSAIHTYYLRMVMRGEPSYEALAQKYFKKTLKYVHRTTEISELGRDLPVVEFNEKFLENLEERVKTKEEKAANIVFALNRYVLVERHRNPVYESLAEKVERILELWKEKTKDFERIYKEGQEVFGESTRLEKRQTELGFDDQEYSLLLALENEDKIEKSPELVEDVRELSEILDEFMFPGWTTQPVARKNVERALRRFIRRYVKRHGLKLHDLEGLYKKLVDNVRRYGKY